MVAIKNKKQKIELIPNIADINDSSKNLYKIKQKQTYSSPAKGTIGVTYISQENIETIVIFKNEWDFISNSINEIHEKTANWSLGNYLEGVLGTLFLPFIIELWKLISNPLASNITEIKAYCMFYLILIVIFLILCFIKKIKKPKFLQTYKDFDNDIKHINQRIIEINNRIGMAKEKEE